VTLLETHEKEKHFLKDDLELWNGNHHQHGYAKEEEEDQKNSINDSIKEDMEEIGSPVPMLKKNGYIQPKIRIVPFDRKAKPEDKMYNYSGTNELKSPIKLVTEIVVLRTPRGITLQQKTSDADLFFCPTDLSVKPDSQYKVPVTENFEEKENHRSETKTVTLKLEDNDCSVRALNNSVEKRNGDKCGKSGSQNTFNFQEEDESTVIVPFTSFRSKSVSKFLVNSKNGIPAEKENTSTNVDPNTISYQHCRDVIEDMLTAIDKMESWKKMKEKENIDSNIHLKKDRVVSVELDSHIVIKVKGKRGRKKKIVNLEDQNVDSRELKSELSTKVPVEVKIPKKRGRKRKYPLPEDPSSIKISEVTTSDSNLLTNDSEPKNNKSLAELLLSDLCYQWGKDDFEESEIVFENPEEQTKESWINDYEQDLSPNETFCHPCNFQPMSNNDLRNHVMIKHTNKGGKKSWSFEKEQDCLVTEISSNIISFSTCDTKMLNHEERSEHFTDKHTSVIQDDDNLYQSKCLKVPKSRIKTCTICGYNAKSSFVLQKHARQVHNIRINPSPKQQDKVPNGNEPITSGEVPRCIPCNRTFTRGQDLVRHKLFAHTNMKQIICEFCSKRFWRQDSFKIHIETVHFGSTPIDTTLRNTTPLEDTKLVTETYEDSIMSQDMSLVDKCFPNYNKKFICNQCGRKYQQKYLLEKHMRFVHPNCGFKKTNQGIFGVQKVKRFLCHYKNCGKMFSSFKKMRFHDSDVHLASKGFKIPKDYMEVKTEKNIFDLKNLSPKVVLRDDPMISTNTAYNGQMFSTNLLLETLVRPRPHKCSKCWKSYTRRHHLKRHMISSHGQKAEDFEDEILKSSFYQNELPDGVSDVIADFTIKEFDR